MSVALAYTADEAVSVALGLQMAAMTAETNGHPSTAAVLFMLSSRAWGVSETGNGAEMAMSMASDATRCRRIAAQR